MVAIVQHELERYQLLERRGRTCGGSVLGSFWPLGLRGVERQPVAGRTVAGHSESQTPYHGQGVLVNFAHSSALGPPMDQAEGPVFLRQRGSGGG